MDASIRAEFGLSKEEYTCLLKALHSRFGVQHIEDIAFLSVEQLAAVTDHWEAAAVKRLFAIAKAHIGVEKLYRAAAVTDDPGLVDHAPQPHMHTERQSNGPNFNRNATDADNMVRLRGLLCRLETADHTGEPIGGPIRDYVFSPFRKSWYTLIASKCRTILQRSEISGKVSDPDLMALAQKLEDGAENRAFRRYTETIPGIVQLWTVVEPRIVLWIEKLDAYTELNGLQYTDKETEARQHYILDHCAKYLLQEMRRFADYYRHDMNAVKP